MVAIALVGSGVGAAAGLRSGRNDAPARAPATTAPVATPSEGVGPPTEAPPSSPFTEPPASEPAPQPPASASEKPRVSRPGRRVDFDVLAEQVAQVRGLPVRRRVRARVVSDEGLADKISELAFSDIDRAETAADERLLVALRLAPPGFDLAGLLERLYRERISGVYVPEESTLYVGARPGALSPLEQATAAHEVTHALQDQAFGLDGLQEQVEDDDDAAVALTALIEGDAVLTQQLWAQRHQTEADRLRAQAEAAQVDSSALGAAPAFIRNVVYFPYVQGPRFVVALHALGGFGAIDEAFRDPPTTTEQILHPTKYREGEGADAVVVETRPGRGWRASGSHPLGEFDVAQLFAPLGAEEADRAAAGWGGGAVRAWTRGDTTAVAVSLLLDSADDAAEVCDAVPRWYAEVADGRPVDERVLDGDRDVLAYACDETSVRLALAPDARTARRLSG